MRRLLLGMSVLLAVGCASVDEAQIGALPSFAGQDAGSHDAASAPPDAQAELDAAILDEGAMANSDASDTSDASDAGSLRDASDEHDGARAEDDDEDERDAALSQLCVREPWHCSSP